MEVREAYLEEFDYGRMAEVAGRETREANMRLMRRAAMASLQVIVEPLRQSKEPGKKGCGRRCSPVGFRCRGRGRLGACR